MSTQADLKKLLRETVEDSVMTHTGRSIGDVASELVADELLQAVNAYITATCEQMLDRLEAKKFDANEHNREAEGETFVVGVWDIAEQRRTLARLTGGTKICTCDCHTRQGAEQDNHCSLC